MIDIHCHILPNIDDGAESLEDALEMARLAVYSGVTEIVATPHFRGEPEALEQLRLIDQRYHEMVNALDRWRIPLKLHKGAEILCTPQTPEMAAAGTLPTIGNTRYVLTEFYFNESFGFMEETLSGIASHGYRPIIAHPERYRTIQHTPHRAQAWVDQGFVMQLNKGSLLGTFGNRAEATANELLDLGLAHLIASDGHGCHSRTPHMGALLDWAEEFCEPEYSKMLLLDVPGKIIRGNPIEEAL